MIQGNNKQRVVSVDISLETTTVAVVDVRGHILGKSTFATGSNPNNGDFTAVLSEQVVALVESAGGYDSIRSVGVCCPSSNFKTGSIENAANLPWKGVIPLAAMLRDRLGLAVALANNAHVRALGEHVFGVAHGMKDFILVTLGSGMGSCIYSNGEYYIGTNGFAGEIGHTCIVVNGRQCGCGNRGCLEMYTTRRGIRMTAMELMAESDKPSLMRQVASPDELTPLRIASFCEKGDELAIETFRRTGRLLGIGLANYASVIDPEAIILTSNVAHVGDWLLKPASEAFDAHVFHNIEGKVKLLISNFNDSEANLLGASALAWEVKEYSLFKE
ncbi:MAG: ROK family protein [Bacteroidales bacterium]|nr:ROK family protein [Bacteroidales bacterium]